LITHLRLDLELQAAPPAARVARCLAVGVARQLSMPDGSVGDLAVVVSELVSMAVPTVSGTVALCVAGTPQAVTVEVTGAALIIADALLLDAEADERGRLLVEALSARSGTREIGDGRITRWAELVC
jgi:hypothetical protein